LVPLTSIIIIIIIIIIIGVCVCIIGVYLLLIFDLLLLLLLLLLWLIDCYVALCVRHETMNDAATACAFKSLPDMALACVC
jgi:hypothetical protein